MKTVIELDEEAGMLLTIIISSWSSFVAPSTSAQGMISLRQGVVSLLSKYYSGPEEVERLSSSLTALTKTICTPHEEQMGKDIDSMANGLLDEVKKFMEGL